MPLCPDVPTGVRIGQPGVEFTGNVSIDDRYIRARPLYFVGDQLDIDEELRWGESGGARGGHLGGCLR
jgi:hypothetical protein